MNYLEFLATLDQWCNRTHDITGAAIVGSYARQSTHAESDIDIALLCQNPAHYTETKQWLTDVFPSARDVTTEQWGPVTALRFWLDELEVELNFSPPFWAQVPVDPGTANVVSGGMTIIKDTDQQLQSLIDAVQDGQVVNIRTHLPDDADAIAQVFYRAVHNINDTLYSAAQKAAWAPVNDADRLAHWQQRVETSRPFVAEYQDQVVGFIELEPSGEIDCFYVDPSAQGLGIGGMLYQQVVNEARHFGIQQLTVNASLAAKPFFEKRRFDVVRENTVDVQGVTMTNVTMSAPI